MVTITLTPAERSALVQHLRLTLAAVIRSDWGETDRLVRLLRRLERESA